MDETADVNTDSQAIMLNGINQALDAMHNTVYDSATTVWNMVPKAVQTPLLYIAANLSNGDIVITNNQSYADSISSELWNLVPEPIRDIVKLAMFYIRYVEYVFLAVGIALATIAVTAVIMIGVIILMWLFSKS